MMIIRRGLVFAMLFSGCGPLEIGSYPALESGVSGGTTSQGGATPVAGSASLGGSFPIGGDSGNSSLGGGSGFAGAATSGFAGSATAGSGFSNGGAGGGGGAGSAGDGFGGNVAGGGFGGSSAGSGLGDSVAGGGFGGSTTGGGSGGSSGGSGSGGVLDRSCRGLEGQCSAHFNCCAASYVHTEEFVLGWDEFSVTARVTVFYPDALEVTVGRFARFVEAFDEWTALGNPRPGVGEHTFIPGTGWQEDWRLPVSREALEAAVTSCPFVTTYAMRDTAPELPMNCVSWFEAFAFCAWDGKRLLTEAEWELAAKGGIKDRVYPWGNEPEPTPDHAVYGCFGAGLGAPHCEPADFLAVGSKPLGNSWHGLRDMAGSVAEWVFDAEGLYREPCIDCANTTSELNPTFRMFRGGGYSSAPIVLATERRNTMDAGQRLDFVGFRCARSLLY